MLIWAILEANTSCCNYFYFLLFYNTIWLGFLGQTYGPDKMSIGEEYQDGLLPIFLTPALPIISLLPAVQFSKMLVWR